MKLAVNQEIQLNPESWVEDHGDYLLGYAMLRLRDRSLAQDAVQDALLTAFKGRERYRGDSSVRTWLTGILKFKTLESLRKHAREIPTDESAFEKADGDFDELGHLLPSHMPGHFSLSPGDSLEQSEFYQTLDECLSKLPDRIAQAFVSIEMDSASIDDVAGTLMIKRNNLYVLLHRARKSLRACLEKNWFERGDRSSSTD
ncbi:sigma-70 family RNA polymerase sigma factor [bacterium]|nr:sigma-70 family RNA polymerase sigma factor [bacterium]